ncbi:MAG TPA: hypothetical protein VE244_10365 [Nitrososphaeraceae archaeon]|nr:hypothetical protein [Nitrososphaeraceae archaeon]
MPSSGVITTKGGVQVWRDPETGELMYKVPRSIQDAVSGGNVEAAQLFQKELDDAIQQLDGQGRQTSIQADQTTPGPTVELAELPPPPAGGESLSIAGVTTSPPTDATTPPATDVEEEDLGAGVTGVTGLTGAEQEEEEEEEERQAYDINQHIGLWLSLQNRIKSITMTTKSISV